MEKIKISVLTPTYNRAKLLLRLYESIVNNLVDWIEIEWLIMDDGSIDDTKQVVEKFLEYENFHIIYNYEKNSGKMTSLNKLVQIASGELIIECDSDDYFEKFVFEKIVDKYMKIKDERDIYALAFLKYDTNGKNMGKNFKNDKTTMFDLYFKEAEDGEKALVFISKIRKQYKYKLEKQEKFITEARMYHEMDLNYFIKCYNEKIMICEYQKDGYTKNIYKQFIENPFGYYEYFKEILERNTRKVLFFKKIYLIKHYILFSYLTNQYSSKSIFNFSNKILYYTLLIPGIIKAKILEKNTKM